MERGPKHLEDVIAPQVEALGLALVRVKFFGGRKQVLQVMIEKSDGSDVSVDDCAKASRMISPVLDVFDPVEGAYALEVSSPGIDRPLTRISDFDRFAGFETKIELGQAQAGRRRFKGLLRGVDGDGNICLDVDGDGLLFAPSAVLSAKLVLTDALIAAHEAAIPTALPVDEGVE